MITIVHSDQEVTAKLVDFGYFKRVQSNILRFLARQFIDFNIQAIRVSLHDIQSIDNKITMAAILEKYSTPEIWLHCLVTKANIKIYNQYNCIHTVVLRHITPDVAVIINDVVVAMMLQLAFSRLKSFKLGICFNF
ncbi:hypothetical protein B4U80_14545 [Leptotrombidium deliense]|uniref:Uncharacterized protein n=1 Tax=Leptotrombidium deliense TaxID=299467 RepID=A0A443RUA6_9ACAR|nr:hypothetical protein B4U80_14545 [Leptotrombidium deliense]